MSEKNIFLLLHFSVGKDMICINAVAEDEWSDVVILKSTSPSFPSHSNIEEYVPSPLPDRVRFFSYFSLIVELKTVFLRSPVVQ